MRVTQILLPVLVALATAACARQQASYYVIDPATQQPVAAQQRSMPPAQPQYAQARYQPASAAASGRGLFSSSQATQQTQPQQDPGGRGLFNTYAASRTNYPPAAYAQPAAYPQQAFTPPPQAYTPPPARPVYAQQTYSQPSYAPQQGYAGQPASTQYQQYQQPSYGTGGPYVAARASNPFAQARWY